MVAAVSENVQVEQNGENGWTHESGHQVNPGDMILTAGERILTLPAHLIGSFFHRKNNRHEWRAGLRSETVNEAQDVRTPAGTVGVVPGDTVVTAPDGHALVLPEGFDHPQEQTAVEPEHDVSELKEPF